MFKFLALPAASAALLGVAAAGAGTPIHSSLADKPVPLPVYELVTDVTFDLGHKNVPKPQALSAPAIVPVTYEFRAFRLFEDFHGGSTVVLDLKAFDQLDADAKSRN